MLGNPPRTAGGLLLSPEQKIYLVLPTYNRFNGPFREIVADYLPHPSINNAASNCHDKPHLARPRNFRLLHRTYTVHSRYANTR